MNLELFISKKIHFGGKNKKTSPAVKIATLGVALGMAMMIVSIAIVIGFKHEVGNKAVGFSSHVQITGINRDSFLDFVPVSVDSSILDSILSYPNVEYVEKIAEQSGVFKTNSDFTGVMLKGVDKNYDKSFFENALEKGSFPNVSGQTPSNEILISSQIANRMRLDVGSSILCYFINESGVKVRKFEVSGIYSTHFTDYDEFYVVGDLRVVQKVNDWNLDQYSSLNIRLNKLSEAKAFAEELHYKMLGKEDKYNASYFVSSIYDINPQLFGWLDLLDVNVWIIITLMSMVAGFTIISGILIIILERTSMIGILKALGATSRSVRKVFIYLSSFLIAKGLFWGNVIGVSICLLQKYFGFLKLDPTIYYISEVPIEINWWILIPLNIGSMVISIIMVIAPTYLISRIKPSITIK